MYEIKDLTTGQTYSKLNLNSVRSMLKVNQNTVYKAVYENKKIDDRFEVKFVENENKKKGSIPESLCIEWDRVTKMLRGRFIKC